MKKRKKSRLIARGRVGEAFCNYPKPKLLLQNNECMIHCVGRKAVACIVDKHIFGNIFRSLNLKILEYGEEKTGFRTV